MYVGVITGSIDRDKNRAIVKVMPDRNKPNGKDKKGIPNIRKPRPQPVPGQVAPGIRIVPPIQLQVQGGAQGIKMRNVNGIKDIEVTENGRKVTIHDDPNQGIEVEIIETKEGKPVTRTFKAKNADELKKKSPEAHKLYKKYAKGGVGNIQQGNIQIQGNVFPPTQIPQLKLPAVP
jgi:translation initiation factor 1 (eIF-1/SUI1)